jgi:hypothetical protein
MSAIYFFLEIFVVTLFKFAAFKMLVDITSLIVPLTNEVLENTQKTQSHHITQKHYTEAINTL